MSTKNLKELLKLLKERDPKLEEYKLLETKCKKILKKVLKYFYDYKIENYLNKLYGSSYLDDLLQEFLIKLIKNIERFDHMETVSESYLVTMAKNLIFHKLYLNQMVVREENILTETSSVDDETDVFKRKEELSYTVNYLENLTAEYIVEVIKEKFNKKELEVLCFYISQLFCDKKVSLSSKERNCLYKRWERIKPRLQSLFSCDLEDTPSSIRKIFEKIWSEICKKSNLKYIKDCL